jgi:hypothetical protein
LVHMWQQLLFPFFLRSRTLNAIVEPKFSCKEKQYTLITDHP